MADESNEVSGSLTGAGAGAGAGAEGGVAALVMSNLDRKITDDFSQYTVRKDLVSEVKGNALVPSYVLEYLLSKYATTTDQESINAGVKRVRDILADNYVHREEANLIQSKIREKGRYQVIDKVQVALNEKLDRYEATFENLGISRVVVDSITVDKNPKLLVTGIWCMCTLVYAYSGDRDEVPWRLHRLMPVQMSHDDRENYLAMRAKFTAGEWIDLLMQSVGFNPDLFGDRAKLLHLVRMIPFVERNYNLIELGPKGTGKSHIYSEFSPHGMLISGGEVTAAKLFVNNANKQIGLVGYWDTVAFDEFAGKAKKADKALVDIMKNYMANKSFSRGTNVMQAEASMVFVGNTSHNVHTCSRTPTCSRSCRCNTMTRRFLTASTITCPGGNSSRFVRRCSRADMASWWTTWRRYCTTCATWITDRRSRSISSCRRRCPHEIKMVCVRPSPA